MSPASVPLRTGPLPLAAVAALALLGACTSGPDEPVRTAAASSSASSLPSSSSMSAPSTATPSATPSPTGPVPPPAAAPHSASPRPSAAVTTAPESSGRAFPRRMTVEVTSVASGCVYAVLQGSDDLYSLRGRLPAVSPGDLLALSGAPDDTTYAACPDGTPFLVSTASPAG